MKQAYFIFNNISSEDYLMVNKLPSIVKAQKDIQKIEIEGRDGFLTQDNKAYKGTIKTAECTIMDLKHIDFICSWLSGSSDVIFSNEPSKKYKATIINQIEFSKVAAEFRSLIIQFECQPFKHNLYDEFITLILPGMIINPGYYSQPILTIYGTGNVEIVVNGEAVTLNNIVEYVTVNSELLDAYKLTALKNNDMIGNFPIFQSGENSINWTGNVTKIGIMPNWRWL